MYTEAEADYLKAIEIDPEDEDYYLDLGDLYKNQILHFLYKLINGKF